MAEKYVYHFEAWFSLSLSLFETYMNAHINVLCEKNIIIFSFPCTFSNFANVHTSGRNRLIQARQPKEPNSKWNVYIIFIVLDSCMMHNAQQQQQQQKWEKKNTEKWIQWRWWHRYHIFTHTHIQVASGNQKKNHPNDSIFFFLINRIIINLFHWMSCTAKECGQTSFAVEFWW